MAPNCHVEATSLVGSARRNVLARRRRHLRAWHSGYAAGCVGSTGVYRLELQSLLPPVSSGMQSSAPDFVPLPTIYSATPAAVTFQAPAHAAFTPAHELDCAAAPVTLPFLPTPPVHFYLSDFATSSAPLLAQEPAVIDALEVKYVQMAREQGVQNAVNVPQIQHVDKIQDAPVVRDVEEPLVHTVHKHVDVQEVHHIGEPQDVLVAKPVEVPTE